MSVSCPSVVIHLGVTIHEPSLPKCPLHVQERLKYVLRIDIASQHIIQRLNFLLDHYPCRYFATVRQRNRYLARTAGHSQAFERKRSLRLGFQPPTAIFLGVGGFSLHFYNSPCHRAAISPHRVQRHSFGSYEHIGECSLAAAADT